MEKEWKRKGKKTKRDWKETKVITYQDDGVPISMKKEDFKKIQ